MCFRHDSAVVALLLCLCCPQWMGCRVNIYQIVSEDSCLKCAPRWDTYPWPLGKGGWTQNVCASTGAWASIIVRAWLSRSLSSNSKGFPVQLPGSFYFGCLGFFVFCLFICLGFGLVLSFWWAQGHMLQRHVQPLHLWSGPERWPPFHGSSYKRLEFSWLEKTSFQQTRYVFLCSWN